MILTSSTNMVHSQTQEVFTTLIWLNLRNLTNYGKQNCQKVQLILKILSLIEWCTHQKMEQKFLCSWFARNLCYHQWLKSLKNQFLHWSMFMVDLESLKLSNSLCPVWSGWTTWTECTQLLQSEAVVITEKNGMSKVWERKGRTFLMTLLMLLNISIRMATLILNILLSMVGLMEALL